MSAKFQAELKRNNGIMCVSLSGHFDGSSAWELINLLHEQHSGQGRVLVDTAGLRLIHPFGGGVFKAFFKQTGLRADQLVFRGEKGFDIAPKGSRVILAADGHDCQCGGDCRNCSCGREDGERDGQAAFPGLPNGRG